MNAEEARQCTLRNNKFLQECYTEIKESTSFSCVVCYSAHDDDDDVTMAVEQLQKGNFRVVKNEDRIYISWDKDEDEYEDE